MIDMSMIIVSYNTCDLLRNCLASLLAGLDGLRSEVFVVDNGSADGSPDMLETEFPMVELIRNESNIGFAAANNIALRRATGKYVALLNPDTVVSSDAFRELVQFMETAPRAGYCGPRLLNEDGTHQPSARRFPTILSAAFSMLGLSGRYPTSRHTLDLHQSRGNRDSFRAEWLSGACLVVRTEAVRRSGLLDEGYFLYFEETDWCRRMARDGWEGWYVASAHVVHLGGQSVVHGSEVRPFSGDHPVHWINSSRRYMRYHHGVVGVILSDFIQILLYSLIWLRHRWRRADRSRLKAQHAAATIRCLTGWAQPQCTREVRAAG